MRKYLQIVAGAVLLLTGCTTTMITSDPEGAEVKLNGQYIGLTPFRYKVTQEFGHINKYRFAATKEGYFTEVKTYYESPMMNVTKVIPEKIHFILRPTTADEILPEMQPEAPPEKKQEPEKKPSPPPAGGVPPPPK